MASYERGLMLWRESHDWIAGIDFFVFSASSETVYPVAGIL